MVVAMWVQKAAGGLRRFDSAPAGAVPRHRGDGWSQRLIHVNRVVIGRSFICKPTIAELSLERYRLQKRLSMFRTA